MRVLLADRVGAVRNALADVLRGLEGVEVVGAIDSRKDLRDAVRDLRPDVVVIDDRLLSSADHALDGSGPTRTRVRVIVVGVDDDPGYRARALRLGAEAWVSKDRADDELPSLLTLQ